MATRRADAAGYIMGACRRTRRWAFVILRGLGSGPAERLPHHLLGAGGKRVARAPVLLLEGVGEHGDERLEGGEIVALDRCGDGVLDQTNHFMNR